MKNLIFTLLILSVVIFAKSQSIEIKYDTISPRQLGGTFPIGIELTKKNGKVKHTRGFLKGRRSWNKYEVLVFGGSFRKGIVHISDNPEELENHTLTIVAGLRDYPEIADTLKVMLLYDDVTIASFTPYKASNGRSRGPRFFLRLTGKYGYDGENGLNGDVLTVYVSLVKDSVYPDKLLQIKVNSQSRNKDFIYYVHPEKGKIHILANGGNAGNGGNGGTGASGRDETGKKRATSGQDGGNGGNGGNGGHGGAVNVFVLKEAQDYISNLIVSNVGGRGGIGGFGGSGGSGGTKLNGQTLEEGDEGEDGYNGSNGLNGPEPKIKVVETLTN